MTADLILNAVQLGLIFAILSLGEYITVNIMDNPDLTVDGSFVTGAAVCAMMTLAGHPVLGLFGALIAGALCGCVTAFLMTKMKIQPLLAGILTNDRAVFDQPAHYERLADRQPVLPAANRRRRSFPTRRQDFMFCLRLSF